MKEHVFQRKIMWGDLDSLGIVFYPKYYEWIDGCSHLFFESLNLHIGDLWRDKKILFGLVETSCRYLMPGRYHQEIKIITTIDDVDRKTVVMKHAIMALQGNDLMAEGIERRICLDVSDPDHFRAIDIPDDIYATLKSASEGT